MKSKAELPSTARWVAALVLERVTDDAAYASRALDAELQRAKLDPRDAALATEIVYGSLRVLPDLDRAIQALLARADTRMDGFVRATLRAAAYQLAHLGRLPTHAIVDESVSQVRKLRGPKLAGFVNALLRKLSAQRPATPEPARALVLPEWVHGCLAEALGPERLARFLAQAAAPPGLTLRADGVPREQLLAQLMAAAPGAECQLAELSPLGVVVRRAGSPRSLPGYSAGAFSVQEEGAQLIALLLGAQPGERIADVCAGHGGKTTLLARQVGPSGRLCALDQDERKLRQIPTELGRIGLAAVPVELHAVDLSVGVGGLAADFDRVLVDAPCTGLGTVHRRPELLLRLTPDDPARLAALQLTILRRAASLVRPGGILGYAVCSPARAEGAEVVAQFNALEPKFALLRSAPGGLSLEADAHGIFQIGPWLADASSSPSAAGLLFTPAAAGAAPQAPRLPASGPDAYQLALWHRIE